MIVVKSRQLTIMSPGDPQIKNGNIYRWPLSCLQFPQWGFRFEHHSWPITAMWSLATRETNNSRCWNERPPSLFLREDLANGNQSCRWLKLWITSEILNRYEHLRAWNKSGTSPPGEWIELLLMRQFCRAMTEWTPAEWRTTELREESLMNLQTKNTRNLTCDVTCRSYNTTTLTYLTQWPKKCYI